MPTVMMTMELTTVSASPGFMAMVVLGIVSMKTSVLSTHITAQNLVKSVKIFPDITCVTVSRDINNMKMIIMALIVKTLTSVRLVSIGVLLRKFVKTQNHHMNVVVKWDLNRSVIIVSILTSASLQLLYATKPEQNVLIRMVLFAVLAKTATTGMLSNSSSSNCVTEILKDPFSDGRDCFDLNECDEFMDDCQENSYCENTDGSFKCTCNLGYEYDNLRRMCGDLNECKSDLHFCDANAKCINTYGSYNCKCDVGYEGNGEFGSCHDKNECTRR